MKIFKKTMALLVTFLLVAGLAACSGQPEQTGSAADENSEKAKIEEQLNLANNVEQEWTYSASADAWVLSVVAAVAYPELPNQQGVSVCVPGAYVVGIDTDKDGTADVTAGSEEAVKGSLIIDYDAQITSTNGQVYTAATAPVILNTGAAGYGSQNNSKAATSHAADGYINVSCGNRGKQDSITDADGNTVYTGDAPSCLVDQKAATRFVKYNILLGNLPGSVDYFVSTGGSGGGAHAAMFAATSNNPDFYDYQIEAGAVGVYKNDDGTYNTSVTIDGKDVEISDGAWGTIAYSAITSLAEADMAQAFEYYMNTEYDFNSDFQKELAGLLSAEYMEYVNAKNWTVKESEVGFDLNQDEDIDDDIALSIQCDPAKYPETNGYYGTYLDLYLAEYVENLQWYLDNLDYATDWTWFDDNGNALSDDAVAAMTIEDKSEAMLKGNYAATSTGKGFGGPMGGGFPGGGPDGKIDGDFPEFDGEIDGDFPLFGDGPDDDDEGPDGEMVVGTPDAGTTQSATATTDSKNYATYEEMLAAYKADIEAIQAGDVYGKNIVELYNPMNYIGAEGTENPTWTKVLSGAIEGDIAMFNSLNMQIAWLNAGTDATIEWQWEGGHVPSEILGDSFALYVDQMYGKYVDGAVTITKPAPEKQTANGTKEEPTGDDITDWVNSDDITNISFTLADAVKYRTSNANKAVPGFDVIDYGQEDYVFGSETADARHWNPVLAKIFDAKKDVLAPFFNQE